MKHLWKKLTNDVISTICFMKHPIDRVSQSLGALLATFDPRELADREMARAVVEIFTKIINNQSEYVPTGTRSKHARMLLRHVIMT